MLGDLYSLSSDDGGYIWNFKLNAGKSGISPNSRDRFGVFPKINIFVHHEIPKIFSYN